MGKSHVEHVSEYNRLDQHEMSALHYAAKYNRVQIIQKLLEYGAGELKNCSN